MEGICALAISNEGDYLAAGSCTGEVLIWNPNTGQLLVTLEGHYQPVWALAFSPKGKILASGGDDRSIRLWREGEDY